MRASRVATSAVSAIVLSSCLSATLAYQDGLWARLRRGLVANINVDAIEEPPYQEYGGPAPEEKEYSYPPYGYPPPPPPSTTTSSTEISTSTTHGKKI
jgi:hypothetical protein